MSQQLINRSPDLQKLQNEGYEVSIVGNYLVISSIPYVTENKTVALGALVSKLDLAGNKASTPSDHVVYFQGGAPCHMDGNRILSISHSERNQTLDTNLVINRSFSNKDNSKRDPDYYVKMMRYIRIIWDEAKAVDPDCDPRTFKVVENTEEETPFCYLDSNSSRAEINTISNKLKGQKVGIIGVGGTGAYILDAVTKTPVQEIHLFDGDLFLQHNAFRCPGAASLEELKQKITKVDHLYKVYSRIHRGIKTHPIYISQDNLHEITDLDFIFVCVDKGAIKRIIFDHLNRASIPFIDVGMGVKIVEDSLIGQVRATTVTPDKSDHLTARIPLEDTGDNLYSSNIQIAELNMLNASIAVLKWKKIFGFYQDLKHEHNATFSINVNQLLNDDLAA